MRAMVLRKEKTPLVLEDLPCPEPKDDELLVKVLACGICRTDQHIIDGDLKKPFLPLILGHEIVGTVEKMGKNVKGFKKDERVGLFWLGKSCHVCEFCKKGDENLCDFPEFTGYSRNGGYAEYTTCHADFALPLPFGMKDEEIAPLLCAGLIGYRSYRKAAPFNTVGFYGFGNAAELLLPIALYEGKKIYAFTREGDTKKQEFAKKLGAIWAGDSTTLPPEKLDAAILFAPDGKLVPLALKALKKGGKCILGEIHMSPIPSFAYEDLWGEKRIESVANLTRQDAKLYFELFPKLHFKPAVTVYPLEEANRALKDVKEGNIQGPAVLKVF